MPLATIELATISVNIHHGVTEQIGHIVVSSRLIEYAGLRDAYDDNGITPTTIELPHTMAERFPEVFEAVETNRQSDCYHFASLLEGNTAAAEDITNEGCTNYWDLTVTSDTGMDRLEPGTTIVYGQEIRRTNKYLTKHWAVTCGLGRVIQVLGIGGPMAVTDISAPSALYGTQYVAEATPRTRKRDILEPFSRFYS